MELALLGESCEREIVPSPWELPSTDEPGQMRSFRGSEESAVASRNRDTSKDGPGHISLYPP